MIYIFSAVAVVAYWLYLGFRTVHFVHMLQLNSYRNERFFGWVKKNKIISFACVVPLVSYIGLILNAYWMLGALAVLYLLLPSVRDRRPKKKPFVNTARTKRLFFTLWVLSWIPCALAFFRMELAPAAFVVFDCLLAFIVMLGNLLNQPIEKAVAGRYIRDAKNILKHSKKLTVIGITGSFGKTGTKHILHRILSQKFNVCMTPGSFNTPMGVVRTIRENLRATDEIFIAEMGAKNVGDIKEICDIVHPKHGIITAIGEQHLETFKSIDNIIKTKWELADSVLAADGMLFVNGDNSYLADKDKKAITYGTDKKASFRAEDIQSGPEGQSFVFVTPDGASIRLQTKLLGRANVINITGCAALSYRMGVSLEQIAAAVRSLPPTQHRLELLRHDRYWVIDDAYNSNPQGAAMALEVLASFDMLRILVTPGMVELGEKQDELNFAFGAQAASAADIIILVGEKQAEPIAAGVRSKGFSEDKLHIVKTIGDAFTLLDKIAYEQEKKPVVLLENDLPDNYL